MAGGGSCQLMIVQVLVTTLLVSRATTTESGKCEEIQIPMCRGLIKYNSTKLPNKFGHATQSQVYWALQPWWPFADTGCSDNLRNFLCGMYLPRCAGDETEPHYPCRETCKKAKIRCKKAMKEQNTNWSEQFKCIQLLPKDSHRCVKPERETKKKQNKSNALCQSNKLAMCQTMPYPLGSLPNMFLQADVSEIDAEMQQFQPLMDTGCSKKLRFFLCGVYMPFCIPDPHKKTKPGTELKKPLSNKLPLVVPCRELCQEIFAKCNDEYQLMSQGLPWPAKFHCNRFPSYLDQNNKTAKKVPREGGEGSRVTCIMPPPDYQG
ncbi:frizzled-10-like [Physella acuta]|uniref:frizzled-10-like n=1 Tax=Physella acuta TaxID=109671 RepID=UPI0027DAF7DA|nr:frizzled-10-like [Physella acuta]